jgi:hypothetical protein
LHIFVLLCETNILSLINQYLDNYYRIKTKLLQYDTTFTMQNLSWYLNMALATLAEIDRYRFQISKMYCTVALHLSASASCSYTKCTVLTYVLYGLHHRLACWAVGSALGVGGASRDVLCWLDSYNGFGFRFQNSPSNSTI